MKCFLLVFILSLKLSSQIIYCDMSDVFLNKAGNYVYKYDLRENKANIIENKYDVCSSTFQVASNNNVYYLSCNNELIEIDFVTKKQKKILTSKNTFEITANDSIVYITACPTCSDEELLALNETYAIKHVILKFNYLKGTKEIIANKLTQNRITNPVISSDSRFLVYVDLINNEPNNGNNCCNYTSYLSYIDFEKNEIIRVDTALNLKNQSFENFKDPSVLKWVSDSSFIYRRKNKSGLWNFYKYNIGGKSKTKIDYGIKTYSDYVYIKDETEIYIIDKNNIFSIKGGIKKLVWKCPKRFDGQPIITKFIVKNMTR